MGLFPHFPKIIFVALLSCGFSVEMPASSTSYARTDDPEAYMDAGQIITYHGYPLEQHYIDTEDGFILNAQRIPHGRNNSGSDISRPAVLLQHGLLAGSDSFLLNIPSKSLAFMLADAGYDVWLSNSRGNLYCQKHRKYNPSQVEFWDWSWQQMGQHDLTANINYVLKTTGQSDLFYVGHSQGTLMAFAQLSIDQELAKKVKLFVALAPIATIAHVKGFTAAIAPFLSNNLKLAYAVFGHKSFFMNSTLGEWVATDLCDVTPMICSGFSSLIMGPDSENLNLTRTPVYIAHAGEGTSVRNMVHYSQLWKSGNFQMYDYDDPTENMKHYNQTTPPLYDPTQVKVPTALFTGGNDWLSDPEDVPFLLDRLPNIVMHKNIPSWNHVDFVLAMNAPDVMYPDILDLFSKFRDN